MRSAKKLFDLWEELYPDTDSSLLNTLLNEIQPPCLPGDDISTDSSWYKDAVIYSLYVDLFNKDIPGLIDKLGYLKDLGVSCLWLLPILGSTMRDARFDISD